MTLQRVRTALVALGLAVICSPAGAQVCTGTTSFASGPLRVGAGASSTKGAKTYGVKLAGGGPRGAFGRFGISAVDYDEFDENAMSFDVTAGWATPVDYVGSIEACPVVGFAFLNSPELQSASGPMYLSATAFSFGGAIGATRSPFSWLAFVPSLQTAFVVSRTRVEMFGSTEVENSDYVNVQLSGGFIINKRLTIQPSVAFPLGLEEPDPVYAIGVSFNLGSPQESELRRGPRRAR